MSRDKRDRKFEKTHARIAEAVENLADPENIVKLGRLAAIKVMYMCSPALYALNFVPKKGLGTFATDKFYRMYYDPEQVLKWHQMASEVSQSKPCETCGATSHHPIAYVGGVVCHEVWHPLRKHYSRADAIHAHPKLWNVAGDCEINDDLFEIFKSSHDADLCLPPGVCHPKNFNLPEGKMAEEYYGELRDQMEEQQQKCKSGQCGHGQGQGQGQGDGDQDGEGNGNGCGDGSPQHGWGGCGSGCNGGDNDYEDGPPNEDSPGVSEAEAGCIERETAEAIEKASATRGSMPAGMERWAAKTLKPAKADWRQLLKAACRWASGRQRGDDLRTYRRLGRRTAALGGRVIFPTTYSPAPSGS